MHGNCTKIYSGNENSESLIVWLQQIHVSIYTGEQPTSKKGVDTISVFSNVGGCAPHTPLAFFLNYRLV